MKDLLRTDVLACWWRRTWSKMSGGFCPGAVQGQNQWSPVYEVQ